ncbi:ABC transporter substrate-binding protein [Cellulomonas marina]|uniref:Lactose/L-arabinose transport system substrate-binding protein n=1 Tax=Cellulomonas marina TaxID=988821 RepID=A0A1I1AJ43_9CELL|nr:extracellular solute-binding protein [Cellulomonas marina]GIG30137.1 ABC transporter substrate-binding protein [Cellulomonas marina]SFB38039.1 lactose/L-arabinose transport system substrate-binding protein [Cellulomonas marina]
MRTSARKLVALGAVLPLGLALVACSGGSDGGSGGGGGGGGGAEGDNTLTVWAWDPAFNIYALEEAEKVYQQENPDFTLDIQEVPWEDVQTRLTTLAQSQQTGELPDIFLMQNNAFQKNVLNYPDLFSDLEGSDVDFSEFPESVVAYSTVDDVHYGVPFDNGTAVTALRTDVLEQAGYTVDDFTDITWDEFITLGEDVLAKTGQPLLSGQAGSADLPVMMLQSAGASLFDEEGNPTIVDNEALTAAIDTYQRLVESGVLVEVNTWDEYINTLVNSTVAATVNGVWILGSIQSAEDQAGKWAITNVPSLDGVDGATNYTANGGSSWAISSNADVELAQDFLATTFAGSSEFYDTILPGAGALANWIPASESDVYSEPQEFFGGDAIYSKVVGYAEEVPSNNTGAYYYEGRDAVSVAITNIMNGTDPEAALAEAQSTVEFAMGG